MFTRTLYRRSFGQVFFSARTLSFWMDASVFLIPLSRAKALFLSWVSFFDYDYDYDSRKR